MFSTQCNRETINQIACFNGFPQASDHPLLSLETLFNAVDEAGGAIFGSIIHKHLSGLNYRIRDIDILVPSVQAMKVLKVYMSKAAMEAERGDPMLLSYYDNSFCNSKDVYSFMFSNEVTRLTNNGWDLRPILQKNSINMKIRISGKALMNINIIALNNHDNFFEKIHTSILKKDFLCNFYYKGMIYQKVPDVSSVKISHVMLSDKEYMQQLRKYATRGVDFTIVDRTELLKPNNNVYEIAKKNYRSKGLVVIPLSRRDTDLAGKAVSISNWTKLGKSYDFRMTKDIDNIGIVCGPNSGIVCIDVDVKDSGVEMFQKMISVYGELPESCPIQRTGNGGYHYIFKYDPTRMANMKAKIKCPKLNKRAIGIDMWIQDCQFVASPSVNYATGVKYTWTKPIGKIKDLPSLPEWIYELYHKETIDEHGNIISVLEEIKIDIIEDNNSEEIEIMEDSHPEVIVVADPIEVTSIEASTTHTAAYKCIICFLLLTTIASITLLVIFFK